MLEDNHCLFDHQNAGALIDLFRLLFKE